MALCIPAPAQTIISGFPSGLVDLTHGWRYHPGDDMAWAAPDFDDTGWQLHDPELQTLTCRHGCWYRLRIQLPARSTPLSLYLLAQRGAFEAYINGQPAGDTRFQPWWLTLEPVEFTLPIPAQSSSVLLAIRIHSPGVAFDSNEAADVKAAIGAPNEVRQAADAHRQLRLIWFIPSFGINLAILLAGATFLLLFASQQHLREYLWLGFYLALLGSSGGIFTASVYAIVPGDANEIYADPAIYLGILAQTEFTFAFIGRRPNRMWRAYEAFLLLCPILSIACSTGLISNAVYFSFESAVVLPAALAIPALLFYWYRRGNKEAQWLILPSLAPAVGTVLTNLPQFADLVGWNLAFLTRPILLWGAAPLFAADLAGTIFLLAIGVVMFFRFTSLNREQARTSAELNAAREIQQQLVPATLPSLPGCRLEAAYIPAAEVGGDFYQILPYRDGSSLVVLGDVSGKGLKAAMTGALAIGSIRTLAAEGLSPGALLTRLNRDLCVAGTTGFITCLCASIASNGRLTLANAGHLPPYLNGTELTLGSSLPLGILADLDYDETVIELVPGDCIAMITDGVVEAQSTSGELFGFERACAISFHAATQMAATAQLFGQNDDITVLTLAFVAGEAL